MFLISPDLLAYSNTSLVAFTFLQFNYKLILKILKAIIVKKLLKKNNLSLVKKNCI
jgi:hypothetical protein